MQKAGEPYQIPLLKGRKIKWKFIKKEEVLLYEVTIEEVRITTWKELMSEPQFQADNTYN